MINRVVSSIQLFSTVFYFSIQSLSLVFIQYSGIRANLSHLIFFFFGTMSDLQVIGGVKKLNNQNYNSWSTCMMSYMQGQDLWEVVNGSEAMQPTEDTNGTLWKWKIKARKAMFALKTTVEEDVLENIRDAKTPKEA